MELQELCFPNLLVSSTYESDLECSSNKSSYDIPFDEEALKENLWSFSFFWSEIVQRFSTVKQLYGAIQDLYRMIYELKESFRPKTESFADFRVERNDQRGVSGSYFLVDDEGKRHFVVKPLDEDAGCIHSDGFATPFNSCPLRQHISLYRSSMREVLAYRVAQSIGVGPIVPKTTLGIIESDQFHDLSESVDIHELRRYQEYFDLADKEKLCSVQEYVQNAKSLFEAIHELEMSGLSDDEIAGRFDQSDFEDANILLWATYDTDGHQGNFLVYPKGVDEIGNELLGIKKIDNGLAFPDQNQQLRNNLSYLPNAKRALSETGKAKIAAMDVEQLAKHFEQMGLESAIPALRDRILSLQILAKESGITIKEINTAMSKIGKKP